MRINFAVIDDKVEQILRAWETTAPEQSFADMSLEQFKQALQPYFAAKAAFVTICTQWDSVQQVRVETYPKALELATGVGFADVATSYFSANASRETPAPGARALKPVDTPARPCLSKKLSSSPR